MAKNKTVEGRAVEIAAVVMQAAGLCRYDSVDKCRRMFPSDTDCEACIKRWLLAKARKELAADANAGSKKGAGGK